MQKRPTLEQLQQQLQTISFFDILDPEAQRTLAETARWFEFEAGEVVFWEGEKPLGLYYLQYGWVRAYKSAPNGREQVLHYAQPGETFNELGAFASWNNPITVVALEPAGVWVFRRDMLQELLAQRSDFARHIIDKMGERVLSLVTLVADLSLRSVTGRMARLILEGAQEGVVERPRWFTQAELAARLGTVPDVVQRLLRSLEEDGMISVTRRTISIRDAARLKELTT